MVYQWQPNEMEELAGRESDLSDNEEIPRRIPVLRFFTKSDCALCDEMKERMQSILPLVNFVEIDITKPEHRQYFGMYRYEIPVVKLDDEKLVMRNRNIDVNKLYKYVIQERNA